MPEETDQVLARQIDAGLASYGGVHRGQQCGRHVDDFHSTEPGAGDEPGEIGHRPSADPHDGVVAAQPEPGQSLINRSGYNQGLGLLLSGSPITST